MLRLFVCILLATFSSAPAAPVEVTAPNFKTGVQPHLSIAPNGAIHLTFGMDQSIFHTSSADGQSFRQPVKIATLEKLALKMRRGPRIVATRDSICVTAISHATGSLHGWISGDDGKTWTDQGPLNTVGKSAREGMHALACNDRGLTALTWLDLRSGKTELWSRVSSNGGLHWGPEVRVYASPDGTICECCHPTVAISPRGEIAAIWRNWLKGSRDMWAAISTDEGRTFSAAKKLGTGTWLLKGCPMDGGSAIYDQAGKLESVWRREATIYSAALLGEEIEITSPALQPVIGRAKDRTVIAYEQNGEIRLWSAPNFTKSLGAGKAPAIASSTDGKSFLAWESPNRGILITELSSAMVP